MSAEQKANWLLGGCKWASAAIMAQWVSLDAAYRTVMLMMGSELLVSWALFIRRNGLSKWCNYMAGWSIVAKGVIIAIIFGVDLLSDELGNHLSRPLNFGPLVALSFSIQQLITIIKKAKGLDVSPPPLVEAIMARAEKLLKVSADIVIEQESPTKAVMSVRVAQPEQLIVSSSDVPQK